MTEITKNKYAISIVSNSARDFTNAMANISKKHKNLRIYMLVTPDQKLELDPITFEPTDKTYEIYGAVLTKK